LSGIIGAIDILKFASLTEEYTKLLNIAQSCSKNLLQIINDILDFSKIEAGKMRLTIETVKLREIVNAASQVVAPLISQKQVEMKTVISTELPEVILGDRIKIKQVLVNFLSNSVKFTRRGSITLKVKLTTISNISDQAHKRSALTKSWACATKYIKISVKDTGVGVSFGDFERIFSAFEQATNKKKGEVVGGTGLGLNICFLLAKLMEGAISVKSLGVDKGSTFSFWFPYQDLEDNDMLKEERAVLNWPTSNARNILLVEDNAVNQLVIKGQLTKLGCKVDVAMNGQLAVNKIQNNEDKYDLVLLDLEMPVKDGITTVMEMRSMGVKTPVVALTAHAVEEKRTMALKAGMDDFLMKPCSIDTLKQCLDKYAPK
jgi:CheY-like chemotaxis protein